LLDNPAWNALTGPQKLFAEEGAHTARYQKNILPFAAYDHAYPGSIDTLDPLLERDKPFFLIGELPAIPDHWQVIRELPCYQMILTSAIRPLKLDSPIRLLDASEREELYQLVLKVQPGYFERGTPSLGNYYGIRQEGKLVAVAGERMSVQGMTEISAICTDPAYTGRGYAQQLITHICLDQIGRGIVPFLHVLKTNTRAVGLYEYMGFTTRRSISFWMLSCSR